MRKGYFRRWDLIIIMFLSLNNSIAIMTLSKNRAESLTHSAAIAICEPILKVVHYIAIYKRNLAADVSLT